VGGSEGGEGGRRRHSNRIECIELQFKANGSNDDDRSSGRDLVRLIGRQRAKWCVCFRCSAAVHSYRWLPRVTGGMQSRIGTDKKRAVIGERAMDCDLTSMTNRDRSKSLLCVSGRCGKFGWSHTGSDREKPRVWSEVAACV
jgi:hypothetical protein